MQSVSALKFCGVIIVLNCFTASAQQPAATLTELRQRFIAHYEALKKEDNTFKKQEALPFHDGLWKKYMRWEHLMQTRLMPDGTLPPPGFLAAERERFLLNAPSATRNAGWQPVGTAVVPSNGGGAGRANVFVFHPSNTNIIYLGTAGGGLWKTTDGGLTWTPLTDGLPVTSIADIALDPTNPNNIYVATGDGYGYEFGTNNDFWGGVYSAGVFRSIDGGITWSPTGLTYNQDQKIIIQRLVIHPTNPQILLAATRSGIMRTTDGGSTWNLVKSTHCYDLEFNTFDPNTIYSGGGGTLIKSTDGGANWSTMYSGMGTGRISIEVSSANHQVIYAMSESGIFIRSADGGTTWTNKTFPYSAGFFGYYDLVLACSDANADHLLAGGIYTVKSTNGGSSWTDISSSNLHVDNHDLDYLPGSTSTIFSANDGGFFKSTNGGSTWTDLSNGLAIAQIYRLASSATDPQVIYSGWQDNGSNKWDGNNSTWKMVYGADGMECMVDHSNVQTVYISYQYGGLQKSTNGGNSFSHIAPCSGNWITPYAMDPNVSSTIYAGCASVYKSTNGGSTWSNIGSNLFTGGYNNACNYIAIAPSNTSVIYAASFTKIYRTTTGGSPWTNITGTLPVTNTGINYIAISATNSDHVWICLGGYSAGNKVFVSTNGGTTWTNISGSLPNIPVNTIVYEKNSPDRVYIGTDIGVFYRDNTTADWVFYNDGLPNVMVHELEINYTSNKLLAATYGRGLWQANLVGAAPPAITTHPITTYPLCPGANISVSFTISGTFQPGNVFKAQLSDANGSFSNPTEIGSFSGTTSGTINATLPATANGSNYLIRVVSTVPVVIGTDNGSPLTITCPSPTGLTASAITSTSATLSWLPSDCAQSYRLRYKPKSGGQYKSEKSTTTSKTISGLSPATEYQWSVKSKCLSSPNVWSAYSAHAYFTTAAARPTNLEENLSSSLKIYPNPASQRVTVLLPEHASHLELTDLMGRRKLFIELAPDTRSISIDLSAFGRGMYHINATTPYKVFTGRLTVN
ncbi:MAG: YCF48-related protein [Chitinophagales bacterium]|nr:YCF48-related protein [Chitinophagales bacterium]MDW8427533.1 YCF48-related protein [Chitinophagales bacterium]